MVNHPNPEPICARLAFNAPESAAGEFMYMPAGRHLIQPTQGGRPVEVEVEVDAKSATALQQQKEQVEARTGQRCYFDFDHDDGAASFWPRRFSWRENAPAGAGVYVAGEWSKPGKEAIEGKSFRSFSPTFHVDDVNGNPARIICNPAARLNMGGLVNCPAFHENAAFFSKESAGGSGVREPQNKMQMKTQDPTGAALENQDIQAKLNARDEQIQKYKERDADRAIEAACARGAIPPANAALKAKWRAAILENPEVEVLLAEMPSASVLSMNGLTRGIRPQATPGLQATEGPLRLLRAGWEIIATQKKIRGWDPLECRERGKVAKSFAAFYAREIRDNPDIQDVPIYELQRELQRELQAATLADDVGTLAGTLVAQRTLELYRYEFPNMRSIVSDFSDMPAQFGQTITTRIISAPAVQTYDSSTDTDGRPKGWKTVVAAKTTDVNTSLDEHVGIPIVFDSNTLASTVRRLFDEMAPAANYSLSKYFVDKTLALCTPANFNAYAAVSDKVPAAYATFPKAVNEFGRSALVDIGSAFSTNEVPLNNRFVWLNSTYWGAASKDPSLVTFFAGQVKPEMITELELPRMARFQPYEVPNFPTTLNRVGFAGHRASIVAVARLSNDYTMALPGSSYGNITTITDPQTGLSMVLVQYVNHTGGYAEWRVEVMIGASVGDKRGGLVITSA